MAADWRSSLLLLAGLAFWSSSLDTALGHCVQRASYDLNCCVEECLRDGGVTEDLKRDLGSLC